MSSPYQTSPSSLVAPQTQPAAIGRWLIIRTLSAIVLVITPLAASTLIILSQILPPSFLAGGQTTAEALAHQISRILLILGIAAPLTLASLASLILSLVRLTSLRQPAVPPPASHPVHHAPVTGTRPR